MPAFSSHHRVPSLLTALSEKTSFRVLFHVRHFFLVRLLMIKLIWPPLSGFDCVTISDAELSHVERQICLVQLQRGELKLDDI